MQKGQKDESPKKVTKTGVSMIDNSITVFVILFDKVRSDVRSFFLIILLFFIVLLGYLYVKESMSADKRVLEAQREAKKECQAQIVRLELEVKDRNEHILKLESDFAQYQRLMTDRADAILDKVLKFKK